jgi:two-component system chemotaxis response regulator CheY
VEESIITETRFTILIVDNDPLIRQAYRDIFDLAGFSVAEASNGADALIWCLKETADIILLDLEMPVMDGWSLLEYRLQQPKIRETPVLVVTSQSDTAALRRTLDRFAADGMLQKPVHPDDLLSSVGALLARPDVSIAPSPEEARGDIKRRDPRVVFSIPIHVRIGSSRYTSGRLRDLSAGGLGAHLPRRVTAGERITVTLEAKGLAVNLSGIVQWAGEDFTATGYRHGIRFPVRQVDSFPLWVYSFFREDLEGP